jgi:hypothetical protein
LISKQNDALGDPNRIAVLGIKEVSTESLSEDGSVTTTPIVSGG